MLYNALRHLATVSLLCLPLCATASEPQPLFASHETLNVRIDAPLSTLRDERESEEYRDGKLAYTTADGTEVVLDLKVRARGKFRRQRDVCPFPPVRLNFRKKQTDGTVFEGQDKLKLVAHCRTGSNRYEQLVLREFVAYRILQLLTEQSFSVRLLQITWQNTDEPDDPFVHYGFVIEDEDLLAKRLGTRVADAEYSFPSQLDREQAALIGVFQYLIGNTDFSMLRGPEGDVCCHNVTLFENGHGFLPIPYDFDFSGLVDAPYAAPNPKYRIRNVRSRLYLGRCQHNEMVEQTLTRVAAKRADIESLIQAQEGLARSTRSSLQKYIDRYFKTIDTPDDIERRLLKECV